MLTEDPHDFVSRACGLLRKERARGKRWKAELVTWFPDFLPRALGWLIVEFAVEDIETDQEARYRIDPRIENTWVQTRNVVATGVRNAANCVGATTRQTPRCCGRMLCAGHCGGICIHNVCVAGVWYAAAPTLAAAVPPAAFVAIGGISLTACFLGPVLVRTERGRQCQRRCCSGEVLC